MNDSTGIRRSKLQSCQGFTESAAWRLPSNHSPDSFPAKCAPKLTWRLYILKHHSFGRGSIWQHLGVCLRHACPGSNDEREQLKIRRKARRGLHPLYCCVTNEADAEGRQRRADLRLPRRTGGPTGAGAGGIAKSRSVPLELWDCRQCDQSSRPHVATVPTGCPSPVADASRPKFHFMLNQEIRRAPCVLKTNSCLACGLAILSGYRLY